MSEFYSQSLFIPGYDEVKVSTGKLARNTDGSILIESGNIVLLATVVCDKKKTQNDFLPLLVEYREKCSAIGKIPGGFAKREGKLTDREILIARLVDRTLRPMFDKNFKNEVQICINLLSANYDSVPDFLICLAASLCISSSDLPFFLPVANVGVSKINDTFILNPDFLATKQSDCSLIIGGNKSGILTLEGNLNEVGKDDIIEIVKFGHAEIVNMCEFQEEFLAKLRVKKVKIENETFNRIPENCKLKIKEIFAQKIKNKILRNKKIEEIFDEYPDIQEILDKVKKIVLREIAFENNIRIDGRSFNEIRDIECEVDKLPGSHGSALFSRGNTQALACVTLGSKLDEFHNDSVLGLKVDNFIVHYNFYGFATSEIKSLDKKISRRELGHGNLATKALSCILPGEDVNPFTIRIVSDILESDGSSSMATVCAGCLALMDAGIKISAPVAGIAMGVLVGEDNENFIILSDISSDEDAFGDMDFKIAGSLKGFTVLQLDGKVDFLPISLLERVLEQAKEGIEILLKKMLNTLDKPRLETKKNAPSFRILTVSKNMIGAIIGVNGKIIQGIQRTTRAIINVIEKENEAIIKIFGASEKIVLLAESEILNIINQPVLKEIYDGVVQSIFNYGAFVEFLPGKVGLLRTDEVDIVKIDDLPSVLKV